jgi:hypothetical protein
MLRAQERVVCTCVGAGAGALAGGLFTLVAFPYDICFTLSCSSFFGLTAGGLSGACTTERRYASIFGAMAGMLIGPLSVLAVLHAIVALGGVGP